MTGRTTPRKAKPERFEVGGDTAVIDFPKGHRYHGLTAELSLDLSIDDVFALNEAKAHQDDPAVIARALAPFLVSWTAVLRGDELPATEAGLRRAPLRLLLAIFAGFTRALEQVVSIDDPLDGSSSSGPG